MLFIKKEKLEMPHAISDDICYIFLERNQWIGERDASEQYLGIRTQL